MIDVFACDVSSFDWICFIKSIASAWPDGKIVLERQTFLAIFYAQM